MTKDPTQVRPLRNAVFSGVCAAALVVFSGALAEALFAAGTFWPGVPAGVALFALGLGLALFAAIVAFAAARTPTPETIVKLIVAADFAWVLASVVALAVAGGSVTAAGRWTIAVVALIVLFFGLTQWRGFVMLRRT